MNEYKYSMETQPMGKQRTRKPTCPFCGLFIERPKELTVRRPGEMPVGSCECGAVYAFDVTGHNLGAAFVEALVFASNMDWDLAWNLLPEEDYLEQIVKDYDLESNLIVPGGAYEGRKVSGALYFVRMHQDILEATAEGVQKRLAQAKPVTTVQVPQKRTAGKKLSKKEIEELVQNYQFSPLLDAVAYDKTIIRSLQRLLCSGDELLRLRAAEALGGASSVMSRQNPGSISKLLQKLVSSITDYGTSLWGAIDAIGEIIGSTPGLYVGYIPTLYPYLEDEQIRAKILKVIGKVAETRPELIQKPAFFFLPFLSDPQPETRAYAAWLFGNMNIKEAKKDLEQLQEDKHEIKIYENGQLSKKTVGQLAMEALAKIQE